jgi:two-component system, cell cycle sensor histidine kinase and response regulator CckA
MTSPLAATPTLRDGQEAEHYFRAVFESAVDAIVIMDDEARFLEANAAACVLFGVPRAGLLERRLPDLVPDRAHFAASWAASLRDGFVKGRGLILRPDGTTREVEFAATASFRPGRHLSVMRDVTETHHAQRALQESNERYRVLFERHPQAIVVADAQTLKILAVNDAAVAQYGYTRGEFLQLTLKDLRPPEDVPALVERLSDRTAAMPQGPWRHLRKDGTLIDVEVAAHPLMWGDRPAWHGVITDVTARTRAEADLRLRERVMEGMSQGLLIADATRPDRAAIYVNRGFERITGYSAAEVLGRNPRFLQGPDTDMASAQKIKAALAAGEPTSVEILNYRKDGTTYWNHLSITPIRDENGRLTHFVGLQTDITERRRLEDQLRQSQKMEAVGTLAGGVAHDFNNMLMVVNGYSEQVARKLGPDDPLRRKVEEIRRAGERATALTRQLLAFSRKQVLAPRVLDLNTVINGLEKMLRRLIGEHIDMVVVPGRAVGRVKADAGQIEQVVMNLVVNARDAMPNGGGIRLETEDVTVGPDEARARLGLTAGRYALVTVADNGTGIDAATLPHIFEPFFTTKSAGKGTGLGLSTVYGIVKQSGGYVGVTSTPGVGTTFRVYLPSTSEPLAAAGPDATLALRPPGQGTVLVAEDDPNVRGLVCTSLEDAGYSVLEARHAGEAVELCERYKAGIDLLLTDLVMPQMNGRELARRVADLRPGIRTLYMSGYAEPELLEGMAEDSFLAKPFTTDALMSRVRDILASP